MNRFIAFFIAIVFFSISNAFASVNITEINWMGSSDSQFAEWFELYNDGSSDVNLADWKLYEEGGGVLVFTLTKTIPSKSYLLVERTTATSPDPVPGINDESGSFGGSGFSNSGENLVLKDSNGTVVQSLDFSSGWPAGDSTTKQTMQWDGSKWITAVATPKAPTSNSGGGGGAQVVSESSTYNPVKLRPHIETLIPKNIYISLSQEYSAKTYLEYGEAYNGVFLWNMGDGTIYKSDKPEVIKHTYQYPGVYTISFAYFRAPYEKKPFLFESADYTVLSLNISFSVIPNKGFQFKNNSSVPFDLSGFNIKLSDGKNIEIPSFSIIPANKTVLMPFNSFGLPKENILEATLETPEFLDVNNESQSVSLSVRNTKTQTNLSKETPYSSSEISDISALALEALPGKEQTKQKPQKKFLIFSGVLVLVVTLFILVERLIAGQEEE